MNEVSNAIQNVAKSSQLTAESSAKTLDSVNVASPIVEKVSDMSQEQKSISDNLNEIVNKFKLD